MSVSALNGGRGIRTVDSSSKGRLNNFAANVLYTIAIGDEFLLGLGGGYLHGTIYNGPVAEHIDPSLFGPNNGAWDVNAHLAVGNWRFCAELASTLDDWPTTKHPVLAYELGVAWDVWADAGHGATRLSASWSEGIQGKSNTPYEFNQQLVLGARRFLSPNVLVSLEYVRSMGFAPLINITTASDRTVAQDTAILGMTLVL